MSTSWKLSDEQTDLWERFQAAYNSIDRFFRKTLNRGKECSFSALVKEYSQSRPRFDVDFVRMAADLRNILVHEKTSPNFHLAIPTVPIVERLEAITAELTNPKRVFPHFQRPVETLSSDQCVFSVLEIIKDRSYSQFPVYNSDQKFCGLLTENGLTRWLAKNVTRELPLVDFQDTPVRRILAAEEKRPNCVFFARTRTVDEVLTEFGTNPAIEAVIITQTGSRHERPLGIATRWDALNEAV
jgi:predicted transcriptional regulator